MSSLAKSRAKGKGRSNGTDKAQALRQRIDASLGQPRGENDHRAFIALENDLWAGDRIDLSGQRLGAVIVELIEVHEYQIAAVFGLVHIVDAAQNGGLVGVGLSELAWSCHVQPIITKCELVFRQVPLALPGDCVAAAEKILEHYPN